MRRTGQRDWLASRKYPFGIHVQQLIFVFKTSNKHNHSSRSIIVTAIEIFYYTRGN